MNDYSKVLMSCDFGIWDRPRTRSPDRANRIYRKLVREDISCVKPSSKIEKFLEDLAGVYPFDANRDDDSMPWSVPPDYSPGHVLLSCVVSRSTEIRKVVLDLSKKHELLCYDPQLNKITA